MDLMLQNSIQKMKTEIMFFVFITRMIHENKSLRANTKMCLIDIGNLMRIHAMVCTHNSFQSQKNISLNRRKTKKIDTVPNVYGCRCSPSRGVPTNSNNIF